jgi:hypothetical protein
VFWQFWLEVAVWQDEFGHPGAFVTGCVLRSRLLGFKFMAPSG